MHVAPCGARWCTTHSMAAKCPRQCPWWRTIWQDRVHYAHFERVRTPIVSAGLPPREERVPDREEHMMSDADPTTVLIRAAARRLLDIRLPQIIDSAVEQTIHDEPVYSTGLVSRDDL